jgi:type IV secretion system protein VirD4
MDCGHGTWDDPVNPPQRQGPPLVGLEIAVLVVGLAFVVAGTTTWAGARLAALIAGGQVSGGLVDWVEVSCRLVRRPSEPAGAWAGLASGLPGPVSYWACTGLVWAATAGLAVIATRRFRALALVDRSRFGEAVDARVARRSDVAPLVVRSAVPPVGRMLLGRMAPRGPLLATEDRERHQLRGRAARRQGHRGSVALIGPTQSGKTVLASSAIVAWDGPVVALSVKRDLYNTTAAARSKAGEVAVFDPGGVTGLASARWSPLRDVTTATGAMRAGRALAQAIPHNGVQGGDFWAAHGEAFISAYFSVAGLSRLVPNAGGTPREPLTIERLATWAYMGAGITDPLINELLRLGIAEDQPLETRLLAQNAATKLMAHHREDPRIRGSIYATARLAFESWSDPSVAHSASHDPRRAYDSPDYVRWERRPRWVDLDWLMGSEGDGRANTLYLAAPDTEFQRLAPVLGGLLGDLREQVHAWDIEGRRLPKPLLFVIDEAGQLELSWLPTEVSTIAGLGAMLVTCWQSKAQITDRYGTLADAVLGGHRSKVFFSGIDDPSTVDYLSKVAGTEHVAQRSWNAEVHGQHRSVTEQPQREDLLPSHLVRQIAPHDAVLIHGTLPPVHLKLVRWWRDRELRRLVPTDDQGRPDPPDDIATCPLSDQPAGPPGSTPDLAVVEDPAARLPGRPRPPATGPQQATMRASSGTARSTGSGGRHEPPQVGAPAERPANVVPFAKRAPSVGADQESNRVAGLCERCTRWVPVGQGRVIRFGGRQWLHCADCTGTPWPPPP